MNLTELASASALMEMLAQIDECLVELRNDEYRAAIQIGEGNVDDGMESSVAEVFISKDVAHRVLVELRSEIRVKLEKLGVTV